MTTQEVKNTTYNFLIGKGLSLFSVCAVMANIQWESGGFKVDAVENTTGIGFGLCQWSFGRRKQLENYGTDLQHQLEFLWSELSGENRNVTGADFQWITTYKDKNSGWSFSFSHSDFMNSNGTLEQLTYAFCFCWERPNYTDSHIKPERCAYANALFEEYRNGSTINNPTPPPQPPPTIIKNNDIVYVKTDTLHNKKFGLTVTGQKFRQNYKKYVVYKQDKKWYYIKYKEVKQGKLKKKYVKRNIVNVKTLSSKQLKVKNVTELEILATQTQTYF